MVLVGAGILPRFAAGLLRHVEDDLIFITHVDGSQMWILLPPLRQVLLVAAVAGQEIGIAEMHLDVVALSRKESPNIFRVGNIDFAELRWRLSFLPSRGR